MVDGYGRLHPRRCGIATHLGVQLGQATIGVAKNPLHWQGAALEYGRLDNPATQADLGECI